MNKVSTTISSESLDALLKGSTPFALIDVRETGEYNNAHIPGASLIPRRDLEAQIGDAVPHSATPVVLCDDDARRATLAAATLDGTWLLGCVGAGRGDQSLGYAGVPDGVGRECA